MRFSSAIAFVDEAGPVKIHDRYHIFLSCVVTNDYRLDWIGDFKYHFRDDSEERRKEFLTTLVKNRKQFRVVLLKYQVFSSEISDHYLRIYLEYPLREVMELVENNVEIFYDSLNDKLSKSRKREFNSKVGEIMRKERRRVRVKLNLSLGDSGKRITLYKKGIMIADYVVSPEFALFQGRLSQDLYTLLDTLRETYVSQKQVTLP
ncbi:hypothetical protein [Metallosphaera sedula]|uniref:hypothetical protein n=1 Tax=Metallosphaera sedula TaxID=43687 RepID=UPI0020BF1D36|nr:hypothetical protein [Metallosphaera sedula]BBL48001.1 hypothetical protein MJ1HA_2116 [Metallosphaera sedula]